MTRLKIKAVFLFFLVIVPGILFCLQAKAQEIIDPPEAKLLTKFPFQLLSGGIIILEAKLDDFSDTLNFILDTGSGGISIDSTTCAYLGLKRVASEKTIRGIGGIKNVEFSMNHTLRLPGLSVSNLDFHINDYDLLTSVYGLQIDGIIGYSFLRRYIVALDYDEHVMSVYTPGNYKYPKGGQLMRPVFSSIPMQPAVIKENKTVQSNFYFDTGAGLCFLMTEEFAKDSSMFQNGKRMFSTQAEGLGGKRPMQLTVVKEVKIGPYRFRKVPTLVFNDEFNVTSYPNTGGLIGNDLLRRFNVVLNYPEQVIHLQPNKQFYQPFDYSYTGLGIYIENGEIMVIDVIKGSPGDKAGFKENDRVIAVDNNFTRNIQVYRTLLQNSTTRIKVIVMRDGVPKILFMKVRNILRKK
ncbi:MAG: hypothetical protein K0Q66_332 [Chitinophagaceae bacterium]|jgi:hypothetical protein|nr:hypothetical protein [Chitinophagaceae bacterium]